MDLNKRIRGILFSHKDELVEAGLKDVLQTTYEGPLEFSDCLNISNKLREAGLHKIDTLFLQEIVSQDAFNYHDVAEKGRLPQDDLYKVNMGLEKFGDPDTLKFFGGGGDPSHNYSSAWGRLAESLSAEKRYVEAMGALSVSKKESRGEKKEAGGPHIPKDLSQLLGPNNLHGDGSPETSYIVFHNNDPDSLRRTIQSIDSNSVGLQKEVVVLVDNTREMDRLRKDAKLRKRIISFEDESSIQRVGKTDHNVKIRLVRVNGGANEYSAFNIGAIKAVSSRPEHVSFIRGGDVLREGAYAELKKGLGEGKGISLGEIGYVGKDQQQVVDVQKKWKDYLIGRFGGDLSGQGRGQSIFDISGHLIKRKNLEELLSDDPFVFNPRLNKHSAEQEFFHRFLDKYSEGAVSYTSKTVADRQRDIDLTLDKSKKNVIFVSTTLENTHGVPVVMNNVARNLDTNEFGVFYLVNDFDTKKWRLYDSSRKSFIEAANREELFETIKSHNPDFLKGIDVLNTHTWHISDEFKHFHTLDRETEEHDEDPMKLGDFLGRFYNAKVVFTDHSNPTEDLLNIDENYRLPRGFEALTPAEKERFIQGNKIKAIKGDWAKRWALTSMAGKRQLSELADVTVNVSNSQFNEGKELIPGYHVQSQKTIYNGIDLLDFSKNKAVREAVDRGAEEVRTRYGIGKDDNVILYAGRLSRRKGIFDLARAFGGMKRGNKDKLLIVGDAKDAVKEKIKGLAGSNVIYTGRIEDRGELATIYRAADLTVQPTHGECFNQVIGESISQGTPVIATDISGPKEVYIDRGWAYGVQRTSDNEGNVRRLAEKIGQVLESKYAEREKVEKVIRPKMRETLSLDRMVNQYADTYRQLSERTPLKMAA
ncbi:MAG: glycosyltransferase family 4 protein [archaeon]|nr:glycosyltransferase family 4 protein [archaeon]MCR4324046.1 glycosyltransferase family 4 protein [Nanoarchaeota archaeon]